MKKIFLLVLLLSFYLPGCRKKTNVVVKPGPVIETVDTRESDKIMSNEADEFSLEDDTGFNVFEDDNKKQVESKEQSEDELKWEEVDNKDKELETIQFEYDSSSIKPSEKEKIQKNTKSIKEKIAKNENAQVRVKGHSCKIAKNKDHNYVVSQERATRIKEEYVNQGIPEERIKAVGYGDSMLITDEDGMESQGINRRAETVIG